MSPSYPAPTQPKTIILRNLNANISEGDIETTFSVYGPLKRSYILNGKNHNTGYVTFLNSENAQEALSQKKIRSFDVTPEFGIRKGNNALNDVIKTRKYRLIIRNLPFNSSKEDILGLFKQCGLVVDLQVPHDQNKTCKGFAFVQYTHEKDAKSAIEKFNGQKFNGRTLAVDWSQPKCKYENTNLKGQNIDNLLDTISKNSEPTHTKKREKHIKPQSVKLTDKTQEPKKDQKTEHKNSDGENLEKTKAKTEKVKSSNHVDDVTEKKTLFIKDIPLTVKEDDIKPMFEAFGPLEYLLFVRINSTLHKGTGFVKFRECQDCQNCFDAYTSALQTSQSQKSIKFNQKKIMPLENTNHAQKTKSLQSSLFDSLKLVGEEIPFSITEDDGSKRTISLTETEKKTGKIMLEKQDSFVINGQQLSITWALSRDEIPKLLKERELHKRKYATDTMNDGESKPLDKRNLHLLEESSVKKCSKRYGALTQADLDKRSKLMASNKIKLKLLQFFVNPVRLTIHNLPKWVDNKDLKKVFLHAVGGPSSNAKIVEARVMFDRSIISDSEGNKALANKNDKNANTQKRPNKKSFSSLCYGFVEFADHKHALQALRNLDNNPKAYDCLGKPVEVDKKSKKSNHISINQRRPIVQFAISNKLALKARESRINNAKLTQERQKDFSKVNYSKQIKTVKVPKVKKIAKGTKRKTVENSSIPTKKVKLEKKKNTPDLLEEFDENKLKKLKKFHNKLFANSQYDGIE